MLTVAPGVHFAYLSPYERKRVRLATAHIDDRFRTPHRRDQSRSAQVRLTVTTNATLSHGIVAKHEKAAQ